MYTTLNRTNRIFRNSVAAVFGLLLLSGCSDNIGGNSTDPTTLNLSVHVSGGTTAAAGKSASSAGYSLSDGINALEIEHVGIVVREIELERSFEIDCDEAEESHEGSDDFCEKFEVGPILLEPSLDGAVEHIVGIEVPDGEYSQLEFDIHKLRGESEENAAFLALHPEYEGLSIRVVGTFNGEEYVFEQDLDEEQELDLDPPLVVVAGSGTLNVTMELDLSLWFRALDGSLVDPRSANSGGENEGLVEHNIKASLNAFEDDDEDGEHDDGDHHEDNDDDEEEEGDND